MEGKSKEGKYEGRESQQQRKEMWKCQERSRWKTVEVECHQNSSKNMGKKFKIGSQTTFLTCLLSYQAVKYCRVDFLINGLIIRGPKTDFNLFTIILSLTLSSHLLLFRCNGPVILERFSGSLFGATIELAYVADQL